jgi:Domain of unknown function (DUF4124)
MSSLPALLVPVLLAIASNAMADIYAWVDASGTLNYSDVAPEGVSATRVVQDGPHTMTRAESAAAREASAQQAEMRALAERVRELEREVEVNTRQVVQPPPQYVAMPQPQYVAPPSVPYSYGCDPAYLDCNPFYGQSVFAPGVVLLPAHHFRHRFQNFRGPRSAFPFSAASGLRTFHPGAGFPAFHAMPGHWTSASTGQGSHRARH